MRHNHQKYKEHHTTVITTNRSIITEDRNAVSKLASAATLTWHTLTATYIQHTLYIKVVYISSQCTASSVAACLLPHGSLKAMLSLAATFPTGGVSIIAPHSLLGWAWCWDQSLDLNILHLHYNPFNISWLTEINVGLFLWNCHTLRIHSRRQSKSTVISLVAKRCWPTTNHLNSAYA